MPWVAWVTLIGALASAGLPPLDGFVSEWLLLQSFLFTPGLPNSFLNMLVPVVAALIALVAALAGYMMVKFFGVIFLGQPREEKLAQAHDAGALGARRHGLAGGRLRRARAAADPVHPDDRPGDPPARVGAAWATPWRTAAGSSSPVAPSAPATARCVFLRGVAASFALAFVLVRRFYHGRLRRAAPWDCGFPWQTRACRTPPRASASRSARSSNRSSASSAHAAVAVRRQPRYRGRVGRPLLALAVPADRRGSWTGSARAGRPAAAGPHRGLPAVQLRTLIALLLLVTR